MLDKYSPRDGRPDISASSVERAKQGDRDMQKELFEECWGWIFAIAIARTGNRADAEELAQETFAVAFENISRIQKTNEFTLWIRGILLHKIAEHFRNKNVRKEFSLGEYDNNMLIESSDSDLPSISDLLAAMELLELLGKYDHRLLTLFYFDHLSLKQVAAEIDKPEGTIKRHLSEARGRLKEILEKRDTL
jgi:RNA polymerase sigma-70 factor (ECF subfamily)